MGIQLLEERYADSLRAGVVEIFQTMVSMESDGQETVEPSSDAVRDEVVGTLGFTGSHQGLFVVSTKLAFARRVGAAMLFMEPDEFEGTEEIADSFGEIVNMVAGNFKNAWVETEGQTMDLSVPSVSFGDAVTVQTEKNVHMSHAARFRFGEDVLRVDLLFHDE